MKTINVHNWAHCYAKIAFIIKNQEKMCLINLNFLTVTEFIFIQ